MRIAIVASRRDATSLQRILTMAPEHRILWIADDATEAARLSARRPVDLVLATLSLEGSDGVEVTRRVMRAAPCAVLIVATSVRTEARRVFEAMSCGAIDAVDMPRDGEPSGADAALLAKIAEVSRLVGDGPAVVDVPRRNGEPAAAPKPRSALVAIGASAGGPAAVATVLGGLRPDFPAAVVVVQHMDAQMASGMAEWLRQHTVLPVRVAVEGESPAEGTVLLASTSDHLALKSAQRLGYTPEPRDYLYRPSVDVFFRSVSEWWLGAAIGVLLTGMGRDGALGLKALRDQGRYTIAQDESSSAVYGMPKAAVALGAAIDVLPVDRIAARLVAVLAGQR